MEYIINTITKLSHRFIHDSFHVACATLVSRIFGLARDISVAHFFGATGILDAFFIAFKVPNLLRRLFAEGAFAQSWVPMLQQSREPVVLFQSLWTFIGLFSLVVLAMGEYAAPFWVHCLAPGFALYSQQMTLAVDLFRILLPFLFFVLSTALFSAAANARFAFTWPALTPLLLNLTTLVTLWVWIASFDFSLKALAWGIVLGGLIQMLSFWPLLHRQGWVLGIHLNKQMSVWIAALFKTLPGIVSVSIAQLVLMTDLILASYLPAGSISALVYADRLVAMPVSLIGVAISTVLLPHLAKLSSSGAQITAQNSIRQSLHLIFLFGLPATIGLVLFAGPLTVTLFQTGVFTAADSLRLEQCLILWAIGLPAILLIKIVASIAHAKQAFRWPCYLSGMALILNIVLGSAAMKEWGIQGLLTVSDLLLWMNAAGLLLTERACLHSMWSQSFFRYLSQVILALVPFSTVLFLFSFYWQTVRLNGYVERWIFVLVTVIFSIGIYGLSLYGLGVRKKNLL